MSSKPTSKELLEAEWESEHLEVVKDEVIDTWRHGSVHEIVVKDTNTGTLWAMAYRRDKDNDYNSARDEDEEVYEVEAKERTITEYVRVKSDGS